MSIYVFDTPALLTYIENEQGAEDIENVLMETLDQQHEIYISVISSIEVFYITHQEQDLKIAEERLQLINDLPIIQVSVEPNGIQIIGEMKANHSMSLADCCIAGLAKQKSAILIHKDPEFEQIEGIVEQIKLPYKERKI